MPAIVLLGPVPLKPGDLWVAKFQSVERPSSFISLLILHGYFCKVGRSIKKLGLKKLEDVFQLIENYCPKKQIQDKTRFFIEEVLEEK
jgi:hypothetical protein